MTGESAEPAARATAPAERIEPIDILRGVALFGVLIVNLMTESRVSIFQQFVEAASPPGSFDRLVERIVTLGFEAKAFSLFSLLFGAGLAMQYERLARRGPPLYWLYRRMGVLLVLGLIHLLLIWNGDILTEYALAGFIVLPLLLLQRWALLAASLALLVIYTVGPTLLYSIPWPDVNTIKEHLEAANRAYASGSVVDVWRFSWHELRLIVLLHLFVFPRTLALFLFGAFLWRAGVLRRLGEFRQAMTLAALAGIAVGAALMALDDRGALTHLGEQRTYLMNLAPVSLALGYGAAILALTQVPGPARWLRAFAPIGRMAFTNYLMQSLVFAFIFFGWGLGQFGRMRAPPAFALGVAVFVLQMLFSAWWLKRYRYGPVEWLWRSLMYGRAQPMRYA